MSTAVRYWWPRLPAYPSAWEWRCTQAGMQGKLVPALFQVSESRRLSAMIASDPQVTMVEYRTLEEMKEAMDHFVDSLVCWASTP